jgi:hypothetical protein
LTREVDDLAGRDDLSIVDFRTEPESYLLATDFAAPANNPGCGEFCWAASKSALKGTDHGECAPTRQHAGRPG